MTYWSKISVYHMMTRQKPVKSMFKTQLCGIEKNVTLFKKCKLIYIFPVQLFNCFTMCNHAFIMIIIIITPLTLVL